MGAIATAPRALQPRGEADVVDIVRDALVRGETLEVVGNGTKRGLGRPVPAAHRVEMRSISGIVKFEPEELVLTARAGTPIAEIEAALAARGQMLAFEPPDLGSLWGEPAGAATLGGIIACNLAGPRRIKAGAARDHVLGLSLVSGRGEAFKAGGRVVKNVTGYDLPKLIAGSFGTLAVMTEITVKTLPAPETEMTLTLNGLDSEATIHALTLAAQSACDVSGAARAGDMTAVRLEGIAVSVAERATHLARELSSFGTVRTMDRDESRALWCDIRDVELFARVQSVLWRLSVPPAGGASVLRDIKRAVPSAECICEWAGGLIWVSVPAETGFGHEIRGTAQAAGGHATLYRADEQTRASLDVFGPPEPALKELTLRVKEQFDPKRALNPGRMYAWA